MAGKHSEDAPPAEVLFERRGRLGVVTLNRPRAVNALTAGMASAMLEQLTLWADDDAVAAVLVRGAGDRGLCAGGDIVAIYRDMLDGGDATADFWAEEYRLNLLISELPQAVRGVHGRTGPRRRGGDLRARLGPDRHRTHPDGHAGDHHRFCARRRRNPAALPLAGGVRHPRSPHRART